VPTLLLVLARFPELVGTLRFAHPTIPYFTPVTIDAVFQISRCHSGVTGIFIARVGPTGAVARPAGAAPTCSCAETSDRAAASGRSTRPAGGNGAQRTRGGLSQRDVV
jgi:hypothetical protein